MPKMIPSEPSGPTAEQIVFRELEAQLPRDWTVIHGRRFVLPRRNGRPIEGEVDFIVIDPSRGYIGLEVKGGVEIGRDTDGWYSVPHNDPRRKRIKDPGEQAQKGIHNIDRFLREELPANLNHQRPNYGHGVVFPDFSVGPSLDASLPREIVIDSRDLKHAAESIDALFNNTGIIGPAIDPPLLQAMMKALNPCFRLVPPLASKILRDENELIRLTDEQARVMEAFSEQPRLIVEGPAGSGKTVLGIQRAEALAAAGQKVLFLCFNKPLADHLKTCVDDITLNSYHAFCAEMAKAAGIRWNPPHDPDASSVFFQEDAPAVLDQALDALPDQRWDAIVVDEGQDFAELWWAGIDKLLTDPTEGSIWIFLDPNQDIYGGGPADVLTLNKANLSYNCRNTKSIAEFSSQTRGIEAKVRENAPEGTQVIDLTCADDHAMFEAVRKAIHKLVHDEKLNLDQIKILSPRAPKNSFVFQQGKIGNVTIKEYPGILGPNQIGFATLQRFKGLESDAIVLCEVDQSQPTCTPAHLYVGTSRAKHHLTILRYA